MEWTNCTKKYWYNRIPNDDILVIKEYKRIVGDAYKKAECLALTNSSYYLTNEFPTDNISIPIYIEFMLGSKILLWKKCYKITWIF